MTPYELAMAIERAVEVSAGWSLDELTYTFEKAQERALVFDIAVTQPDNWIREEYIDGLIELKNALLEVEND